MNDPTSTPPVDPALVRRAAELVVRTQFGSARMLSRRLAVSFATAAELMLVLEENGVVGPLGPFIARDVLVTPDQLTDAFYASLPTEPRP